MRGFAQTLFNALLGWIRTLVEGVWNILFSSDAQQWLKWVGDNWMILVVFLCLCGVALDYVVWFFRWRPYYVWGSSMRRLRRFFGGGKPQREEQPYREKAAGRSAPRQQERRRPEPGYQPPEEPAYQPSADEQAYAWQEEQYAADPVYEQQPACVQESIYDQVPMYEPPADPYQPQPTAVFQKPAAAADTILARPRKADYQEQYVRRFARPEPALPPEPVYEPVPQEDWSDVPQPDELLYDAPPQEEYWAPEMTQDAGNEPIHPGIDYQALSRQYGWHVDRPAGGQAAPRQPAQRQTEQQPAEPGWDFSGLDGFTPYRAPEMPSPQGQRPERAERTKKPKPEGKPLNKVRSGLSRIAQRAGKVLTVDDEQAGKLIDGLPPPIDKRRAFHAPVYPNRPGSDKQKSPDFQEDD